MKDSNIHNLSKFYKGGNYKIVKFLYAYILINGITVARILADEVKKRYGVTYNIRWITVILKSSGIARATRKDRGKTKENRSFNPAFLKPLISFNNYPGLLLFDILFMQGPGKIIAQILDRRDSYNFVRNVGLIFASGCFERLSNYKKRQIKGINVNGKSLSQAVMNISKTKNLCPKLNIDLLTYWLETGIDIKRLFADGHIKIFFTLYISLTGKISSSGRIAPGTKMVLIHQQQGIMLWLAMHRIDEHLGKPFIEDCVELLECLEEVKITIPLIVDKEGSGKELAKKAKDSGIFLLTLVRTNSYKGLEDFVGDVNFKGLYRWASEKKEDDCRYFVLVENAKNKLIVFSVNFPDNSNIEYFHEWYVERWNGNENPLKVLVREYSFNTNIGQGVEFIDNPKQIESKAKAEKELPILEEKLKNLEKKKPRLPHTIVAKENEINKTRKQIEKCNKVFSKPIEKVSVKKTEGDGLISILKGNIYNVLLYLLIQIDWPNVNPQEVLFVNKALTRQQGILNIYDDIVVGKLRPLEDKRERLKQEKLINGINKLKIRTNDGKLLMFELLDQKAIKGKNSSFG